MNQARDQAGEFASNLRIKSTSDRHRITVITRNGLLAVEKLTHRVNMGDSQGILRASAKLRYR
ncbi:hypothetical protein [Ferrimonas senticii]|uniref:hypothetical protein n=1 Tax=Ferrimonas senticii TaxID=394566 RepID=UPI0004118025|nr:hypothetical protein [Ferrimonas senticii]